MWNFYEPQLQPHTLKSVEKLAKFQVPGYLNYNRKLFFHYNQHLLTPTDNDPNPIDPIDLWHQQFNYRIYAYQVQVYDEKIAYQCQLLPFQYRNKYYITVSEKGSSLCCPDEPYLSAYMVLTTGYIHPNSFYFTQPQIFERMLGSNMILQIRSILNL